MFQSKHTTFWYQELKSINNYYICQNSNFVRFVLDKINLKELLSEDLGDNNFHSTSCNKVLKAVTDLIKVPFSR